MVGWERGGHARRVRIWPLLAFAVSSAIWPVPWWWSQLRTAQRNVEDSEDSENSDDAG